MSSSSTPGHDGRSPDASAEASGPPEPDSTRGRRGFLPAAAAAVGLTVAGVVLVGAGLRPSAPPQPPLAPRPAVAADAPAGARPDAGSPEAPVARTKPAAPPDTSADAVGLVGDGLAYSRPVGLDIPAIDVRSDRIVELGQADDGTLEVPTDYAMPGWYEPGPAPGQFGPAVIAGHVDSKRGPAVFYRLGELEKGDDIRVRREDGRTARFVIDRVERYPKDDFPTVQVYGDTTRRAELRLITCGGAFDERTGHYVDNVVAYAHLV